MQLSNIEIEMLKASLELQIAKAKRAERAATADIVKDAYNEEAQAYKKLLLKLTAGPIEQEINKQK